MDSWDLEYSHLFNQEGIPILKGYVLDEVNETNRDYPLPHIDFGDLIIPIAEIKQAPLHFIMFNVTQGKMMPGILELDRFREAGDDDV